MTSHFSAHPGIIEIASEAWCWTQLHAHDEAMLSFWTPRARLSLAAAYDPTGEGILVAADPFDGAGWMAAGHEMTLEIAGVGPEDLRWLVRATGLSRRAEPAKDRPARGVPSSGLILPSVRVRGYYETYTLDAPGWDDRS